MDSLRSETRSEGLFVIHEVEEEETLYSIAKRYESSIGSIKKYNEIIDSRIEIGQVISVLYQSDAQQEDTATTTVIDRNLHRVLEGETLYSISKIYDVRIKRLRSLNNLGSNDISPGQYLRINDAAELPEVKEIKAVDTLSIKTDTAVTEVIPNGFEKYLVQTGESLNSIARKRRVSVDSLKIWNNLPSDYLRIGQPLMVRFLGEDSISTSDSTKVVKLNEEGFNRVYEEGIAAVISEISTSKYLALHRTLPIGTELQVRNLMNNLVVHVKVVGKLPDTGLNRNILVRLSKPAYEQLGILDPKSRVEISHFKE